MEKLTHSELKTRLLNLKGATWCSIKAITTPDIFNKGGRKVEPMLEAIKMNHDGFRKHTKMVGLISCGDVSYQDFVNNRLEKEAKEAGKDRSQLTFSATEHKWATRVENSNAVLEHKYKHGQYYLVVFCVANNKPITMYSYDNEFVDVDDTKFDLWRKPPKTEGNNQGTKERFVVKTYAFTSLEEITLNKETFKVVPD